MLFIATGWASGRVSTAQPSGRCLRLPPRKPPKLSASRSPDLPWSIPFEKTGYVAVLTYGHLDLTKNSNRTRRRQFIEAPLLFDYRARLVDAGKQLLSFSLDPDKHVAGRIRGNYRDLVRERCSGVFSFAIRPHHDEACVFAFG
jgi:hypothetical protein